MASPPPLRIGLAGLGRFGRLHLEVLASLAGVGVVALCDRRPAAMDEAAPWAPAALRTTEFDALLQAGLDAVDVVTTDESHASLVRQALEHGLHVFVEKPLATSHAEAAALSDLATERGRRLQVGFVLRYEWRHAHLKELIAAGRLGQLATLRLKRHAPQSWFHAYGHTVHPMLESTIHDIDLCLWYVGRPCRRVYAADRAFLGLDGPDTSAALLEFEGGTLALIDASWLLPSGAPQNALGGTIDASVEVIGTRSTARIDFLASGLTLWEESGVLAPELSAFPRLRGSVRGALRDELADFVGCVRSGRPSEVASHQDAVAGLAIVEAARRSAAEGRPVGVAEVTGG